MSKAGWVLARLAPLAEPAHRPKGGLHAQPAAGRCALSLAFPAPGFLGGPAYVPPLSRIASSRGNVSSGTGAERPDADVSAANGNDAAGGGRAPHVSRATPRRSAASILRMSSAGSGARARSRVSEPYLRSHTATLPQVSSQGQARMADVGPHSGPYLALQLHSAAKSSRGSQELSSGAAASDRPQIPAARMSRLGTASDEWSTSHRAGPLTRVASGAAQRRGSGPTAEGSKGGGSDTELARLMMDVAKDVHESAGQALEAERALRLSLVGTRH